MTHHRLLQGALFGLLLAACASPDESGPSTPSLSPDGLSNQEGPAAAHQNDPERSRHDRLARRVARALRDSDFRQAVFQEIATSGFAEKKVHLQAFMAKDGGRSRRRMAELAGDADQAVQADLDQGPAIEMYFPVASHRQQWAGGSNLVVATAERDGESPVAYDLQGRRFQLSPTTPPTGPVLMVERAELRFDRGPAAIGECIIDCGGGTGGGTGAGGTTTPGVYMTAAKFSGTFESWFKGNPEFEVHVLGQAGTTNTMTTHQCAGERALGANHFDQNSTSWTGSVLLFSSAQFDQYRAQHPGQNLRVFVVEDDDTACEIKIDSTRTSNLFKAVKAVYGDWTGAHDTTTASGIRLVKTAPNLLTFIKAILSWFKTNDDPVGNAVEDPIQAGAILTGANWVVKGESATTNGAIKLEYR